MKQSALKTWMAAATVAQQEEMAELANTTRGTLYQYVSNRTPSAEKAALIEAATIVMHKRTKGKLPVVYRTDLSTACSQCQFARKCIGMKAEFPLLGEGA